MTEIENRKLIFGKDFADTKFAEEFGKTLNEKMPEIIDVLIQHFGKDRIIQILDSLKKD